MDFFLRLLLFSILCSSPVGRDIGLLDELKMMHEKDQRARFSAIDSGELASEEGKGLIGAVDQENLARLKEIVRQVGWPGIELVGEEGADKMWLLVQHSDQDLEFQKLCLGLLKEAVTRGDAPKRHLAYLTDRILVSEGLPQLYGTQVLLVNGQPIPRAIENPDQLEIRRKEMGLEPFADYLSLLKKVYRLE